MDFPYTFLRGDTLFRIMHAALGREPERKGVFMEINSTKERPVRHVPDHFRPLVDAGQPVRLHRQLIRENLTAIYDSKYFVKMGGRPIRGNSVAEAVSLGTLAVMDSREVTHRELIIPVLDDFFFRRPLQSLANALDEKRRHGPVTYGWPQRIGDVLSTLSMKRGWKH